jgi:hypothetical protein
MLSVVKFIVMPKASFFATAGKKLSFGRKGLVGREDSALSDGGGGAETGKRDATLRRRA